jgi:hypothetical protein
VASSEQRLHSVLATLEQCRAVLADSTNRETAQLVSVAILQLRMTLNRIADSELKALCDAMTPDDRPAEKPRAPVSPQGQRRRSATVLKLVK